MKVAKERLDILLVEKGLAPSREKAKAIIMSGIVYVDGNKEDKAGSTFPVTADIVVKGNTLRYVSRGGLKLEKAVNNFGLKLDGRICMDVGSSTGGFTDCMLQNGASKVYAVDVGHGQLDWKLRNDERVVCMEKTNIRYVKPEDIGDRIDFSSIDVSFISLTKVLGVVKELLTDTGCIVCLIKPQFEAGREKVGKKGVVRDKKVHKEVIEQVVEYAGSIGLMPLKLDFSPVKGPEGNIEYLLYLTKDEELSKNIADNINGDYIEKVVEDSHITLEKKDVGNE
jgi:23S rRNA (cytidine1920-2'-O)/16S rRNA (cytidine1409-2'-O)-methyltransferase